MRVRPYAAEDLSEVLRLCEHDGKAATDDHALSLDQIVDLIASGAAVAFVAEAEDDILALALATVAGPAAWVHCLTLLPDLEQEEIVEALLDQLEPVLVEQGARRVGTLAGRAIACGWPSNFVATQPTTTSSTSSAKCPPQSRSRRSWQRCSDRSFRRPYGGP